MRKESTLQFDATIKYIHLSQREVSKNKQIMIPAL